MFGTAAVQSRYRQAVVIYMTTGAVEGRLPELLECCLAHRLQQFDDGSPEQLMLEVRRAAPYTCLSTCSAACHLDVNRKCVKVTGWSPTVSAGP